jgi:uncharacterized protein YdhG (YjbR/CyaY superfamily)
MAVAKKKSPYGSKKFKTVSEYHAAFPPETRERLNSIRELIREAAPDAVETISYNMPAFRLRRILVYYAAFQNHISLFPPGTAISFFKDKLSGYHTSRGTIQFPHDKKLPLTLIRQVVKYRVREEREHEASRVKKSR